MECEKSQDSGGFTIVTHKQKRKRKSRKHIRNLDVDVFQKSKIESIQKDLSSSEFFSSFKETLNCALNNRFIHVSSQQQYMLSNLTESITNLAMTNSDEIDIVCYGLGNFITCMIARYQLAFLMELKTVLKPSTVVLYDPIFSTEEKSFLKELRLDVLDVNEEAKRTITRRTIFFMPHCDLPLYDNVLCANWTRESLSKLIIIGNSFEQYMLNKLEVPLKETARYLYFAKEIVSEVKIHNNFQFTDIFNNLSVHYFEDSDMSNKWNDITEVNVKSID